MRFLQTLFHLITFFTVIQAITLPAAFNSLVESGSELHKRKGGGGGRAGGGSSSGSRGSSSSSSGSSGSSGNRGSSGGASAAGTGTPRNFGGGSRYGGGAATPYRNTAASRSSWPGPTPFLLGAGALALFPGLWLYGAYAYPYSHRNNDDDDQNNGTAGTRTYLNETTNQNETRPVQCLCAQYEQCSCEDSTDQAYLNQVANDKEVSSVRNGTLYINGTLANDTSAPGTTSDSAAGGLQQRLVEAVGYWPIIAGVAYTMWFL